MRRAIRDVYQSLRSILIGMRITFKYLFARTVTVQYPDVPPPIQPRYRGFHWFEIERCSACKSCLRACPVDCIYIENSAPRKVDKETGISRGGAITRWAIDYSKCMFCGLCCEPCPTECIKMGELHDHSSYRRRDAIVEFTELAEHGLRTPVAVWMMKEPVPDWARELREQWAARAEPMREEMRKALTEQPVAKKPVAPAAPAAAPAGAPPAIAAGTPTAPAAAEAPPPANDPPNASA